MRVRPPKDIGEQVVTPVGHDSFIVAYPDYADAPDDVAKQLEKQGWEIHSDDQPKRAARGRGKE